MSTDLTKLSEDLPKVGEPEPTWCMVSTPVLREAVAEIERLRAELAARPAVPEWKPPTSWEIIRAAEEVELEGLTEPYLSDGDRYISDSGKDLIRAVRRVLELYTVEGQRASRAASPQPPEPLEPKWPER